MDIKRMIAKGLRAVLQPPALTNCNIDKTSKICSGTQINNSIINKYSYVGHDCFLLNAEIGSFVSIADNCRIGGATHSIEYVSSSPVFNAGKNILKTNFADHGIIEPKKILIQNDVWIGANTIIMSGVTIENGAVIGAGSIVTHDVHPYEIWAGNPARCIRMRFTEEVIKKMLDLRWWDWPDSKIKEYAGYFDNPEAFLEICLMNGEFSQ